MRVFLIAGEPSGDVLGAELMGRLCDLYGDAVRFSGVGGPTMEAQGLRSLFPMTDLSVMGIAEVLPRLWLILKRLRQTVSAIVREKPDIVVTIDSPDFTLRVVRRVRRRMRASRPRFIHYVAPSVWAWRPGRARKLAQLVDTVLCLLPFETPYFEREGLQAVFVGHPVTRSAFVGADGSRFRAAHDIPPDRLLIGLFPGSRRGEVRRTGFVLFEAARLFAAAHPGVSFVVPTLDHLRSEVEARAACLSGRVYIVTGSGREEAFAACNAAMATSGTVGLELAAAGVPHLIAYRMNTLSWLAVRVLARVRYAHLVNILLDRPAVPEFIQSACVPENLCAGLKGVLAAGEVQRTCFREALCCLEATPDAVYKAFSHCRDDFSRFLSEKQV